MLGGGVNPTGRITSCLPPPSREDVAPADGGPGLPGRRPALPASDGAVEALPGPALLPLAVRLLVRVPRGGLSGGETPPELTHPVPSGAFTHTHAEQVSQVTSI